ncbi:2-amino-4-hydroxy-6-hydroxymethyldihydropteridine diphosphokinase [Acetatifactor muris]|uniref:Bifunctional folate synthesis protein n=1 Tax=Acetatifactor muris TaxID=879566 RepID=A0A2K4ZFU8_9FIRM|nr:2-amino-4-hydroxy-6-hydroxymethyldihydropteridine diphosphokinase [Acetatifactor muris]MCR2047659.1 2-amino-4-hydroxy-6-hydroxymethyldihydropteridine diphosphokinase [Acetatifactor muris]SOY29334.1 Bifunctional folate synthesis protein [Acetatifactor muris]
MFSEWAEDEIHIDGLEIYAHHGAYEEERTNGQTFYVNAVLYMDTHVAGVSDELEYTTDYGNVCRFMNDWMRQNTCRLLEAVAERMANALLLRYRMVSAVDLEIQKPHAPVRLPFEMISVKVHRSWHRAYIALGSNMGDREAYLSGALKALKEHPQIVLKKVSDCIVTEPYGGVKQEDFLNSVAEIETLLNPEQLLEALHEIENAAGRERTLRWGPRTLDLDILFYDRLLMDREDLVIPHPDLENRRFVLEPMTAIAPYFRHPATGKAMRELLQELEKGPL